VVKFSTLKTKQKILVGICAPMVLLLVLGGVSGFSINSIVSSNKWVVHTFNVLGAADSIVASAVDMETGMRGYLLAGKEEFLDPYNNGQELTYARIAELQQTVSDNPPQVARLAEVEQTLREWQAQVTEPTIALRREIGDAKTMDDMADLVGEARGKVFFDKFREQIATFIGREQTLLDQRSEDFANAQERVKRLIANGGLSTGANIAEDLKIMEDSERWVIHTYKVIAQANDILAAAVDMETGMRGFLLAGREEFLDPYVGGRDRFGTLVDSLQETVSDNPAQVQLLNEIKENLGAWQTQVTEPTIQLRRDIGDAKTMNDMAALVGEARGKVFFDKFRGLMAEFSSIEAALMESRQAANASTVTTTFITIVATILIAIGIGVALAMFIGKGIAGPIIAMTETMRKLAAGDKSVEIPGAERVDEIGDMSKAVQVFKENAIKADELAAQQAEQEKRAEKEKREAMLQMADDLEQNVKGVVDSVSAAANEMGSTAQTMSAASEQTTNRAGAVASASEEATTNAETVAAASEELSQSIQEIGRQVSEASGVAEKATKQAEQTNVTVQELAQGAEKIGEVVSLINDIADQTNLLALNATIEASRAGEAGKGFAVVAAEVKSLAAQTANATEEIGQQINTMQATTSETVSAIEAVVGAMGEINGVTANIASSVEQQNSATQEIARSIQETASGTRDVTSNIGEVSTAAQQSSEAASTVVTVVDDLTQQSQTLNSELDSFLSKIRAA
jgi:methyl-accepting chemotaxis protein